MIDDRPLSADRVPTLTEVVELDFPPPAPHRPDDNAGGGPPLLEVTATEPSEATPLAEAAAAEAGGGLAPATADPVPQAMADDFELAGLETEEIVADGQAVPEPDDSSVGVPEPPPPPAVVEADALVGQVLSELMPRIDMLLESRLREALAPALARAADGLIRDTRSHLAVAVRDLVQEAVDRALQRRSDD